MVNYYQLVLLFFFLQISLMISWIQNVQFGLLQRGKRDEERGLVREPFEQERLLHFGERLAVLFERVVQLHYGLLRFGVSSRPGLEFFRE